MNSLNDGTGIFQLVVQKSDKNLLACTLYGGEHFMVGSLNWKFRTCANSHRFPVDVGCDSRVTVLTILQSTVKGIAGWLSVVLVH